MKRKTNKKIVWNLISLIAGSYFVIEAFYKISIRPFFTKQMAGFTPFGLVVFVLSLFVISNSGNYLYERLHK